MNSETRRIPPSEWDHWKSTILGLTRKNTLNVTRAIMKDKYGFSASRSQYETQLDIWKDRKNLKKDEWADILEIVDKLDSKHSKYRVLISGHPITASRIQRARRYCKGELRNSKSQGRSSRLQDISFETLGADGRWTAYANFDDSNESGFSLSVLHGGNLSSNPTNIEEDSFCDTGPDIGDDPGFDERQGRQVTDDDIDLFGKDTAFRHQDHSYISDTQYLDVDIVGGDPLPLQPIEELLFNQSSAIIQSPSQQGLLNSSDINFGFPCGDATNWASLHNQLSFLVPLNFQNPVQNGLNDLPFKRFEEDLKIRDIDLTSRPTNVSGMHVASVLWNPVKFFLADVKLSKSDNENQSDQWPLDATSLLSSFKSLLCNEDLQGGDNRQILITEDEMLQTNFNRLLVFSIANGFTGLQGVPIQSVLKHLSRYGDVNSLLQRFLQASQSHVPKALTENLFRAAIEAKDERTLKRLLAIGSVDINTTTCIVNGEKYTPIERAVSLKDVGMVKLLLRAKADVNKTSALKPSDGGALARLISGLDWRATITPEVVELSELLLKANAKVHLRTLEQVLKKFTHNGLAYRFVSGVSDYDHSELIRRGLLSPIVEQLDDLQATETVKKIILACRRRKCGTCLTRFEDEVDWALVQGAKRGYLQLVQLLLRCSKTPHRALSAAIRCGRSEVIDAVLTLEPDMNAPAHSIDLKDWDSEHIESYLDITTSLAEAIEAGAERLIRMLEGKGALEHLDEGRRFQPAIAAAANTGNILYVRKLLNHYPSPEPSQMASAVLYAVRNDYEEVFWALLAAGADVNLHSNRSPSPATPLFAAMLRRNSRMVRGILNADVDYGSTGSMFSQGRKFPSSSVLREALEWGDISIIQDLRATFPSLVLEYDELFEVLTRGNMALFKFLVESGMVSRSALTRSLKFGLSTGDTVLVGNLIEMGADPTDESILSIATINYPKMLPLILEQIPFQTSHHVIAGFGTGALNAAIRQGPPGFEAVKLLLDSGLVDTKAFCNDGFRRESPLGLAIKLSRNGEYADFAVIRKLLDTGCDPNSAVASTTGRVPVIVQTGFLEAIETRSKDLVHLMISRGANVKQEASMGLKRTPLQKAVEVGSLEIVTLILGAGVDVNARPATRGGATALQFAAIGGNCNIAAKLMAHGADLQALPAEINGRWPLEGAAEHGRLEMIEFLWKMNIAGFDREQCQRAMKLAEENGHMACKNLIMELSQTNVASVPAIGHEWF